MTSLGKLNQIKPITTKWPDEARDFTPWLASEIGLALVGETLGFGPDWLEMVETEASVGKFRADILCRDTTKDEGYVIIENQFGATNHDHLGKLLTYMAGRKSKTVIWVAESIRDEHRAAMDLLNEATSDEYQFFAFEIELWQIGESEIAPRFNIVAKPNDWTRATARAAREPARGPVSELKLTYVDYWTEFKAELLQKSLLRCQKPSPQQWMYIPIGRAKFTLTANVNSQQNWIMVQMELHGEDASKFFWLLETQKEEINDQCPFPLSWQDSPHRMGAKVVIQKENTDPTNREDWAAQHEWMIDRLNALYDVFHARVKALDLSDLPEKGVI